MDAVYPLGPGSIWGNKEIDYSTRLLKKYTNVKNIFTVGQSFKQLPNIPATDNQSKIVNLWEKCYLACQNESVSDPFLFINDDHYIIKPTDIDNYPNYYSFKISEYPYKTFQFSGTTIDKHSHPYWSLVYRTEQILGDVLFFNVHCPVIIHKKRFIDIFTKYYDDVYDGGLLLKTTYLQGLPGVQMDDYKTRRGESLASIKHHCKDRHIFSSCDEADNVAAFLDLHL